MEDIIATLKAIRIPFKSEQDNQGIWHSWPDFAPGLWGEGKDIPESINDMITLWRECTVRTAQGETDGTERLPYFAKVLVSTDEELKSCLDGKICG